MADAHERAVRATSRTGAALLRLFGQVGTADHPRGQVLMAYRTARLAVWRAVEADGVNLVGEVRTILGDLRARVAATTQELLGEAYRAGYEHAEAELEALGLANPGAATMGDELTVAALAVGQVVEAQVVVTTALIQAGDTGQAVGDDPEGGPGRQGTLLPGTVGEELARWLAIVALASWDGTVRQAVRRNPGLDFRRQAVAAIDERTTDCCLRVHGQVVGLDQDFHLTGTPRFADDLRDPPFHWWCRTAVALVRAEDAGDDLTRRMQEAAQAELAARAEAQANIDRIKRLLVDLGEEPDVRERPGDSPEVIRLRRELRMWRERLRVVIHPAHGTSRR